MASSFNTSLSVGDPSEFRFPYGRHADVPLAGIPTQYLRYVYANHSFTYNPKLQRSLEVYLGLPEDPTIRVGNEAAQAFAKGVANGGNGATAAPNAATPGTPRVESRRTPQTGLDGFKAAFERARREALLEFEDDLEIRELLEDILGRVRRSLGI